MYAENKGVKIWYEVFGNDEPTLVIVHGFQIAYSEAFKRTHVPFLSRHMRVITLDLRGNGRSDRPDDGYDVDTYVEDVHAVIKAAGLENFAMVSHSCASNTIIKYQSAYPDNVTHLILLNGFARMIRSEDYPQGMPEDFLKGTVQLWRDQPEDMLQGFIAMCCSEKNSLRAQELLAEWAHETSPDIWERGFQCPILSNSDKYLKDISIPVLIIHGQEDKIVFPDASEYLHDRIPKSKLILIPRSDHLFFHSWPQVSRHILTFLKPDVEKSIALKKKNENPMILWISSPIGLGHIKRDISIVNRMRKMMPNLIVHWLCADPVRSYLETIGEEIHPLSSALRDESGHLEHHGTTAYSLNVTEAYWEMDKILNNNFMVFTDAVRENPYDLVVGDESWEVVEYLHYNPTLKTAPFVFITDFIGVSEVDNDPKHKAHVQIVNATCIEMRELHPEVSDLSLFIGKPEDLPDRPFGEGFPNLRDWTKKYFRFPGYVLSFDPKEYSDQLALREQLGFSPEEKILIVAIGGTATGRPLIEKCLKAQSHLKDLIPGIKMVVLCGPRIDPKSFPQSENVEFQNFIPDVIRFYAICDLAIIQGGLSTAMELTALRRPFLYFPLNDHFEQQDYVDFRLKNYKAGIRMDFNNTDPKKLAEKIAQTINTSANYKEVETDGSLKAADMIIELLQKENKETN